MDFREIPSLSRLLDIGLEVEVVEGDLTTMDYMQSCTVSVPTEDFYMVTSDSLELLYLRPMVKALAEKINTLGDVKVGTLPIPEKEMAWQCTNGRIPVLLRIVRRSSPDRHQILIHALVEPVEKV
jgi:hypothetical protein